MKAELEFAGLSDKGKTREKNEDTWMADPEMGLFLVSDGMGGQAGGALAARVVRETLPEILRQRMDEIHSPDREIWETAVGDSILEVNALVNKTGRSKPGLFGMGATLVIAVISDASAIIAHMGDSRIYLFRDKKLEPLTIDHSVVRLLVDSGDITASEAENHPARGQITRFMGMADDVLPDMAKLDLEPGDRLLLCSDGLTNMVSDEDISGVLRKIAKPDVICRRLVDKANDNGGSDNITVTLVDWLGP